MKSFACSSSDSISSCFASFHTVLTVLSIPTALFLVPQNPSAAPCIVFHLLVRGHRERLFLSRCRIPSVGCEEGPIALWTPEEAWANEFRDFGAQEWWNLIWSDEYYINLDEKSGYYLRSGTRPLQSAQHLESQCRGFAAFRLCSCIA